MAFCNNSGGSQTDVCNAFNKEAGQIKLSKEDAALTKDIEEKAKQTPLRKLK
jgi:hypothetical protein